MKKCLRKIIVLLILIVLLFIVSGCGSKENNNSNFNSGPTDNIVGDKEETNKIEENNIAEENKTITQYDDSKKDNKATETKTKIIERNGLKISVPSGYTDEKIYGLSMYSKETNNGKIYLDYVSYIDSNFETEDLTTFLNDLFYFNFKELYTETVVGNKFKMNKDKEESDTILNTDAKKITGKIHYSDKKEDLRYIAYYSLVTLDNYKDTKIPMLWIAFGDDTANNMNEMENALKTFALEVQEY